MDGTDAPLALADDLGLTLSRLGTVTRLRLADALAPLGLTMRQFAVLRALAADEGLSQRDLGRRLQIDASSIVLVLDDCQNAGWAERRPSPNDRRRYALYLTSAGRRVLLKAREATSQAQEKLFAPLDEAQRQQLHDLVLLLITDELVSNAPAAPGSRVRTA